MALSSKLNPKQKLFGIHDVDGRKEGMVRHQKEKAQKEWKGKHVRAGQSLPAWIVGFCGILGIPVKQENEELLLLLQVPEVFEYVIAGAFQAVVQQSFNRRNDGIRKNTHYAE